MSTQPQGVPYPELSAFERFRAMTAVVLCGVVVLIGGASSLLVPTDPAGSLSVLCASSGWLIIPVGALVSFVLAAGVTWLSEGKLEELGMFAVCLGLALLSMRFENASYLWLEFGQGQDALRKQLAGSMALETVGWLIVMAAAYFGCRLVAPPSPMAGPSASDSAAARQSELRRGALTVLCMSAITAVLIPVFSGGTELTRIETGQVYFACAAAFYVAGLIAYQLTAAHSPLWAYITVGLVAIGGYVYTMIQVTPEYPGRQIAHLMQIPPTDFGRALPVQIVTIGLAAAVFGNWHQRQLTRFAIHEQSRTAQNK